MLAIGGRLEEMTPRLAEGNEPPCLILPLNVVRATDEISFAAVRRRVNGQSPLRVGDAHSYLLLVDEPSE